MNKIPLLDLKIQHKQIRQEIDEAVKKVLDSTNFILGEELELFEQAAAKYNRAKFAVGVASGTDAILLSLKALGIGQGDKVITSSFTYFATAGAIMHSGATPVFVDIDPKTYNIYPERIAGYLKNDKAVKAIVPVDLYGQIADMKAIKDIAKKYNLMIVEDAAQAFGAEQNGKKAGTFGDCGTFSFYPGKNLGADGDAGMILTDSEEVAIKLKILRNQGNDKKYYHAMLGYNSRLDTLQAAILRVKLRYLDKWNTERAEHAKYYDEKFPELGVVTPFVAEGNKHIYHQYVIRVKASQSQNLIQHLNENGIDARTYYPLPLHLQECFKYLGYKEGDLPESEKCAKETLAIPVYPELTQGQLDFIIVKIKEFLEK